MVSIAARHAARVVERSRGTGRLLRLAVIRTFENDVDRLCGPSGAFEYRGERHTRPLRVAHGAKFPERGVGRRPKESATVSRAL